MIEQITNEIDKSIGLKADNPKLSELVILVIADSKKFPNDLVEMCYEIHEFETDTTSDESEAKKYNLKTYKEFSFFLESIKEKYSQFWLRLRFVDVSTS